VNNLTFGIVTQLPDLAIAISLVASTGGVSVLPLYARIMLPPTVVSRPIDGAPPMINLALEYSEAQGCYGQTGGHDGGVPAAGCGSCGEVWRG
jgi:hypothetical protein